MATLPSLGVALEAVTTVAAAVAAVAAIRGVATRAALKAGAGGACAAVERRRAIVKGVREGILMVRLRDGVMFLLELLLSGFCGRLICGVVVVAWWICGDMASGWSLVC